MTFEARERSTQDGAPIEIFTFARDEQRWRYTSADRDVTLAPNVFLSRPLRRTEIESTNEKARLGIKISAPRTLEVVDLYRVAPPSQAVTCIVQQYHEGDGELVTIWTGRVLGVEFAGAAAAEIALEPIFTSIRRIGLRRLYQRQCPHVLYGAACKVNRATFRVDGTVSTIVGQVVSVAAASGQPAGWFAGGYIEFATADGATERRFVLEHTGVALTLASTAFGLSVGGAVSLFPGCDHSITTCTSKFSNAANYGGFPYFPLKNPFGGDPIF